MRHKTAQVLLIIAATFMWSATSMAQDAPSIPKNAAPNALSALLAAHPHAQQHTQTMGATLITGLDEPTQGDTPQAQAMSFIARWGAALGIKADALRIAQTRQAAGQQVVLFEQVYGELTVYNRHLSVTLDARGHVLTVNHSVVPIKVALKGEVDAAQAGAIALRTLHGDAIEVPIPTSASRVIIADGQRAIEAWLVAMPSNGQVLQPRALVSTLDGAVLSTFDAAKR